MTFSHLLTAGALFMLSLPALGASPVVDDTKQFATDQDSEAKTQLLARKKKKRGKKARERHITREAKQRSRDSKNIDFDAVDIGGATKTPMSSLINQNKPDKNYDFIKIRLRWHPEMVQSASSLNSGNSR